MSEFIDPKEFGLPPRTRIEKLYINTLAIVIDRKSRIIRADGKKILDKVLKIKEVQPNVKIVLKTTAPICSKTIKFLDDHKINII